ncbi:hypothetical protein PR048_020989 [Dryococelus australis]|uniref:Uncharacterized protein n=1 Tax=Dryococelus australis TaxID=614101 RepID=A0ABQ9GWZ4_9NEOP|nr:hypothetical protein PR048_020989 [Dryococelus australis]
MDLPAVTSWGYTPAGRPSDLPACKTVEIIVGIKRKRTLKTDVVPHLFLPNATSNECPEGSERLKNRTVQRKLVSDLTKMRKRKRHPENSKREENKNNGTHVVTQELNERTRSARSARSKYKIQASFREYIF